MLFFFFFIEIIHGYYEQFIFLAVFYNTARYCASQIVPRFMCVSASWRKLVYSVVFVFFSAQQSSILARYIWISIKYMTDYNMMTIENLQFCVYVSILLLQVFLMAKCRIWDILLSTANLFDYEQCYEMFHRAILIYFCIACCFFVSTLNNSSNESNSAFSKIY